MRSQPFVPSALNLMFLGIGWLILGCAGTWGCPQQDPPSPSLAIRCPDSPPIQIQLEVASEPSQRERGLMYRKEMPNMHGMLFIYPIDDQHTFWMKNTFISLDMIFISSRRRVVGLVERPTPLSTASVGVDTPSRYVLEVNGGFAKEHSIREGCQVEFFNIAEID